MKKSALIPAAIFPYTILLSFVCIRYTSLLERYFNNNIFLFLIPVLLWWGVAFLLTHRVTRRAERQGCSAAALVKTNLILKLIHLPFYALICLLGLPFLLTAWFFIIVPLAFTCLLSSLITGLVGRTAVLQGEAEGYFTRRDADLHGVLLLLFGFDVYSTIYLWRKLRDLKQS